MALRTGIKPALSGRQPDGFSEGSGISRSNKISPDDMIKILIEFMPWHNLLRKDDKGFYKTGTLSGIKTIAGRHKSIPYEKQIGRGDPCGRLGRGYPVPTHKQWLR